MSALVAFFVGLFETATIEGSNKQTISFFSPKYSGKKLLSCLLLLHPLQL